MNAFVIIGIIFGIGVIISVVAGILDDYMDTFVGFFLTTCGVAVVALIIMFLVGLPIVTNQDNATTELLTRRETLIYKLEKNPNDKILLYEKDKLNLEVIEANKKINDINKFWLCDGGNILPITEHDYMYDEDCTCDVCYRKYLKNEKQCHCNSCDYCCSKKNKKIVENTYCNDCPKTNEVAIENENNAEVKEQPEKADVSCQCEFCLERMKQGKTRHIPEKVECHCDYCLDAYENHNKVNGDKANE